MFRCVGSSSWLLSLIAIIGCAEGASVSPGAGEESLACEPGEQRSCACMDGTQSVQLCNGDGTALLACECGGDSAQSGGFGTGGFGTGGFGTGGFVATGGIPATAGDPNAGGSGDVPVGGFGNGGSDSAAGSGFGGTVPVGGFGGIPEGTGGALIGGFGGAGGAPVGGSGGGPVGGPAMPMPTATCPEFINGTVGFTVDGTPRSALIYMSPTAAASSDGPVVFYWYGTGGQPTQASTGLSTEGINRITAAGGIVVAPTHINSGTFPWIGGGEVDFRLMDEVVGCAEQKIGIDETHIHALGFSAGALFTAQVSFSRSSYVASVATYSGGGGGVYQDPSNKFAAMILFGGAGDTFVANFADTSRQYYDQLKADGHYATLCDHGGGHSIPTSARASVVQFFFDHPFGVPSPYAGGFPFGFPSYCSVP